MKLSRSILRATSLALTLALLMPSSTLALRVSQEGVGLEELQRIFPAPTPTVSAVGLEKPGVLRPWDSWEPYIAEINRTVRQQISRGAGRWRVWVLPSRWARISPVFFDNVSSSKTGRFHPEWALVKGAGEDWWIHLHLSWTDKSGFWRSNGLLFRVLHLQGKIIGLTDAMAEPEGSVDAGFIPLKGLLFRRQLHWLTHSSWAVVKGHADVLEEALKGNQPKSALGIAAAMPPGSKNPLYQMLRVRSLGNSDRGYYFPRGPEFIRLDREGLSGVVSTGLEEPTATDWADIHWLWNLEPWQRDQLLHGVPGQAGFFLNGWSHKEQANPGIVGMVEAWPRFNWHDSGALWWHTHEEDFFKHLLDYEFFPSAAPWAGAFRQGVEAIRGTGQHPGYHRHMTMILIAYLKFLARVDTSTPFRPEYASSLRQFAAATAGEGNYPWGEPDQVLTQFFDLHNGSAGELGPDLRKLLDFKALHTIRQANDLMEPLFTDPQQQGPRFTADLISFLANDEIPVLHALDELFTGNFLPSFPRLEKPAFQTLREWLSQGKVSELDAFLLTLYTLRAGSDPENQQEALRQIGRALDQRLLSREDLPYLLQILIRQRSVLWFLIHLLSQASEVSDRGVGLYQELPKILREPGEDLPAHLAERIGTAEGFLTFKAGLLAALQDKEWKVREIAVHFLEITHWAESVPILQQVWNEDESPTVRMKALEALAENARLQMTFSLTPLFLGVLTSLNARMRWAAAAGLARLQPAFAGLPNGFVQAALTLHPEWATQPPSSDELSHLLKGLSWLPPMGGKVPIIITDAQGTLAGPPGELSLLPPTWTAEEQAVFLMAARKRGQLGRGYVHQLTVQGRLPDDFKYMAVALILSNPHRQDWNKPFFEAWWGHVAPMIHDGGNFDPFVKKTWKDILGRTDFLQRVAGTFMGPEQRELARMEQDRLVLEAKAYQRLALALHAARGTVPSDMPEALRLKLANRWDKFKQLMDMHLGELELTGPLRVRWFAEEFVSWTAHEIGRKEADWPPIQKELLNLNAFAEENPRLYDALRLQVVSLLKRITDDIDQDIGLLPTDEAAGLEETEAHEAEGRLRAWADLDQGA